MNYVHQRLNFWGHEFLGFLSQLLVSLLSSEPQLSLCFPLEFKGFDDVLVLPAHFVRQSPNSTILAAWVQSQHPQGRRYHDTLLRIIRRWDSLVGPQSHEGSVSSFGLVGQHSSHDTNEDLRRGSMVERASSWVDVTSLPQEIEIFHC